MLERDRQTQDMHCTGVGQNFRSSELENLLNLHLQQDNFCYGDSTTGLAPEISLFGITARL